MLYASASNSGLTAIDKIKDHFKAVLTELYCKRELLKITLVREANK